MIEIKELVVRAIINEAPVAPTSEEERRCAQSSTREGANQDVIESCVRQVLAILNRQKER